MNHAIMVGMGEIKVSNDPNTALVALGLGSCIGVCAYDPQSKVAGMVHVVLPDSNSHSDATLGKYANTAVPALLEEMRRAGANVRRLQIAIAGGAQLFSFNGSGPRLDVGARNGEAVKVALKTNGVGLHAEDVGGNTGRTVNFSVKDGTVRVKTLGQGEKTLASLSGGYGRVLAAA